MEIIQLRYFKTVAELEHISKAADELKIPQPYLSQIIKKLEYELGTQLFERIGKRIVINEAGKILLRYADHILYSLDNAFLELNTFQYADTQNIAISFQSASMLIPGLMKEVMMQHPNLSFSIYQQNKDIALKDMDLTIFSSFRRPPGDNEILLLEEELKIVMPKTHRLNYLQQITIDDLRKESFISLCQSSNLYKIMQNYYSQMNLDPKITCYIENPSVMRDMLINGFGISIIPSITWYNITKNDMVLRPIKDFKLERLLFLSWNSQKYMTKSVKSCMQQITEYFSSLKANDMLYL